ncbi:MAG: helix-turn-helix transcriptional regulator [Proteiniphilum sp.]|jgi:transcriptional regulator with XRE-family HTH domain|nr:helix-turn-helix transcriptional regulator [Proteiniphilum sp.]
MLKIKAILKDKGLTIQELADMLGISRVGLSQQINGSPRLDSLQKIANALEVDLLDLFEDTRRNKPKEKYICPHCKKPISIEIKQ